MFQDYSRALLPWRTVAGNVLLALEARGVPRAARPAEVNRLLHIIGLADHAAFPLQLSGGMQQRVQIARALAQRPRLLLMDEPFGSLDAMTRQALQDEIARLCRNERQTVLFVTHDLEEAIYLGDRVVALEANPGRVIEIVDIALPRPRDQLTTREHPRSSTGIACSGIWRRRPLSRRGRNGVGDAGRRHDRAQDHPRPAVPRAGASAVGDPGARRRALRRRISSIGRILPAAAQQLADGTMLRRTWRR